MSTTTAPDPSRSERAVHFGNAALRYSLAIILLWIGGMKFTAYEAAGIQPLVATSPLMSWLYRLFSVQATSNLIGIAELTIAVLILLRPIWPRIAFFGSLGAITMFLTTLSFLLSLPAGVWAQEHGFPMLGDAGGFLIKDLVLLGASLSIAAEAYSQRTHISQAAEPEERERNADRLPRGRRLADG